MREAPETTAALGVIVPTARSDNGKTIVAWCLYDWANSPFTTLVVTFVYATYFTRAIAPNEVLGTVWWSRAAMLSAILVAFLSPVLGALADRGRLRRLFLLAATLMCIVATTVLTYIAPGTPNAALIALTLLVVANIGFETGMVFYNSLLPAVAPPQKIGRVSGYGWALGYLGGLACLVLALVGFVQPEVPWFGLSKEDGFNIRATNLLVAVWFTLFSVPFFLVLREERCAGVRVTVGQAFRDLSQTFREVRRFSEAAKFLLARLVYNDGLVTIFAFGGIYAAGTFGMDVAEILVFGIVLNVVAGAGALASGFVDDKIGGKMTVMASLAALATASAIAVWAPTRTWLWIAGILIGISVGANQSASRSLMGRFVPAEKQAEFFGFFAFSGKFTAFLGPLFFGLATQAFDSQRVGMGTVFGFFAAGGLLLARVDENRGITAVRGG